MSRFICVEMSADAADNRPLGDDGEFLTGTFGERAIAKFPTREAAERAGQQASNRRQGCELWVNGGAARMRVSV
jgi:hypothetical protein